MSGIMSGHDIHVRIHPAVKGGAAHVSHFRAWDRDKFIQTLCDDNEKNGNIVEVITLEEYREEKRAEK